MWRHAETQRGLKKQRHRGSKRYPSYKEEQDKGKVAERHPEQNMGPEIQNHPNSLPYRPRRFSIGKKAKFNLLVCFRVGEKSRDKAR